MRSKLVVNVLAIIAMSLVLAGVALVYWAGEQRNLSYGPAQVAEDSLGRVLVLADRRLFTLGPAGRLLSDQSLESMGVDSHINALAAMADGRIVLGSMKTGLLYVLTADGQLLKTLNPAQTYAGGLFHSFALDYDPVNDRLLVAHIGHHRVLALDADAGVVYQAGSVDGSPGIFHFPNEIKYAANGLIYVSDTNNHQVHVLRQDLSPARQPVAIPEVEGYPWPVSVAPLVDGRMVITVLEHGMREGKVILVSAVEELLRVFRARELAEPTAVLAREDDVLVTDQGKQRYQVLRFDHDGNPLGRFGDVAFQQALDTSADRYRQYESYRALGQLLAFFSALLLIVVYVLHRRGDLNRAGDLLKLSPAPEVSALRHVEFFAVMMGPPFIGALALFLFDPGSVSPELALVVLVGLVLLIMIGLIFCLRLIKSPRYAIVQKSLNHRMLVSKLKRMPDWDPAEPVLAYATVTRRIQTFFLLLTPGRLVLIPFKGGLNPGIGDSLDLGSIRRLEKSAYRGLWQVVLGGPLQRVSVFTKLPGESPWSFLFIQPGDVEPFLSELKTQLDGAGACRESRQSAPGTTTLPPRPMWSSLALSALLPGLGHLNQKRNDAGVVYLAICATLLSILGVFAYVHLQRISQVDTKEMYMMAGVFCLYWLVALFDVWRYGLRRRRRS